jgi:hypothetical protein
VKPDDIDIQVRDNYLIVRAEMRQEPEPEGERGREPKGQEGQQRQYLHRERRYGYFERTFPLPENVDNEKISCNFEQGVLTIHLPKTEQARQQGRRIPIMEETSQARGGDGRTEGRELAGAGRKGGEAESAQSAGSSSQEPRGAESGSKR